MVSPTDTAVLPQGTAAGEGLTPPTAPPGAGPTETLAPPPGTETAPAAATETAGARPEPTPPQPRGIDDLSEAELAQHPTVRSLVARQAESARQVQLDQVARERTQARQTALANGQHIAALATAVELDDQGNPRLNAQRVSAIFGDAYEASSYEAMEVVSELIAGELPRDYRYPREVQEQLAGVQAAVAAGRMGINAQLSAALQAFKLGVLESERPGMERQIRRDVEREFEAKAEADRIRAGEQRQAQGQAPSRGAGGIAVGGWASQAEIDRAVYDGTLDQPTYLAMRRDGRYSALPAAI